MSAHWHSCAPVCERASTATTGILAPRGRSHSPFWPLSRSLIVTSNLTAYSRSSSSDRSRSSSHRSWSSRNASRASGRLSSLSCIFSRDRSLVSWSFLAWSCSCSHSCSSHHTHPPKDRQEEHASANIVDVVGWIRYYGSLPHAPSESCKIRGFKAALDVDDQPSCSYLLPMGDSSSDIFLNIDDCISSITSGMRLKFSNLLPYPWV